MALIINTNISSLIAQNNLTQTSNALQTSLERLSSGLKINSAADGPAALVISEQQKAQIAGLQTAIDNSSKGIALIQTTEGAERSQQPAGADPWSGPRFGKQRGQRSKHSGCQPGRSGERPGYDRPHRRQHTVRNQEGA